MTTCNECCETREALCDDALLCSTCMLVAERAAGAAEERARIVAMMRADAALWPDDSKTNGAMLYLADRIERGET